MYGNPSAGFLGEFLIGSLDQASRERVEIVVETCEPGAGRVAAVRRLIDGGIDGVVLPPPLSEADDVLDLLASGETPVVTLATGRPRTNALSIGIDDYGAALTMTRHIISFGHRRIGFVSGAKGLAASQRRLEGSPPRAPRSALTPTRHRAPAASSPTGRDSMPPKRSSTGPTARPRCSPPTTPWPPRSSPWLTGSASTCRGT